MTKDYKFEKPSELSFYPPTPQLKASINQVLVEILSNSAFSLNYIGQVSGRETSILAAAINADGNFIKEVINAKLDTSAKQILSDFTFGASGAIQIGTYVVGTSGDIKISPVGIVARNSAGANTIAINGTTGEITAIKLVGASGNIGGWVIAATALYYDGATDAVSSGQSSADYPFYAGKKYADRATAPFRVTPAGVVYATGAVIDGTSTIAGITGTQISYVATSTADIVPTGLACSSTTAVVASDGSVSSSVVLTWNVISTNTFDHYLIRFKKATADYYTYIVSKTNTITIEGLVPNQSYNFGIASVNKYGSASAFSANIAQTTATSTTAPATVVVGSATAGIQYVIVEWTHSASTDLASYNIYRHTANDSGAATLIGNCRTNYFVDGGRTGGTEYFYWVKAVNTSGLVSAAFSTVKSATPRNVTSDDVVTLAGSKVLIDGAVYLSNWRKTGDLTKIDGGYVSANTVELTSLNFVPVQDTDVIAKINASAEGITIDADNLTINAATTFAAGYNPSIKRRVFVAEPATPYDIGDLWTDGSILKRCNTALASGAYNAAHWGLATGYTDDTVANSKIKTFAQDAIPTSTSIGDFWIKTNSGNKLYRAVIAGADEIIAGEWVAVPDANKLDLLGGSYASATSGARVIIFPDANTGIQAIDDAAADVFKILVGGANVGDVIVGNYSGGQGIFYDKSENKTTFAGILSAAAGTLGALEVTSAGHIRGGQTAYNTGDGFFLGYSTDKYKFSVGNPEASYLTYDGIDLVYTGKSRITFKIATIFETAGRFLLYSDGVTFDTTGIRIRPNQTIAANRYSTLKIVVSAGSSLNVITGTSFSVYCHLTTIGTVENGNNGAFYIGTNEGILNGTTLNLAGAGQNTNQYGFKAIKTNGVVTLYATNSNGTNEAETTTSLGTIGTNFYGLLTAVSNSDSIKFYKDNVLVATHTTNLPAVSRQNWCLTIGITNLNTAYDFDFNVNSANFEKFAGVS